MKKLKKILSVLMICVILFNFGIVLADDANPNFELGAFEGGGEVPEEVTNLTKSSIGTVISITRIVAVAILTIIITIIGIRYMVSSAGERADIKKYALNFLIAAIIIFGSTFIIEFLIKISEEVKIGE